MGIHKSGTRIATSKMFHGNREDQDSGDEHEREGRAKRLNAEIERIKKMEREQETKARELEKARDRMEADLKKRMDALSVFRNSPNFRSSGYGSFSATNIGPGLTASRSSSTTTCSFNAVPASTSIFGGSQISGFRTTSKCNTPDMTQQDLKRRQEDQKRHDQERDEKIRKLTEEVERLKQKEKEQEARIKELEKDQDRNAAALKSKQDELNRIWKL